VSPTPDTHTSYSHLLASLSPTNHRFVADILAVNDLLGNEPWSDSPRQHGTLGRSSWCCTLFARTGASSEKQFSFLSWHINLFQRSLHFLLLLKHLPAADSGSWKQEALRQASLNGRPAPTQKLHKHNPSSKTNSCSASQEILHTYGTPRFITVFTTAHHLSLSSDKWDQPTLPRLDPF